MKRTGTLVKQLWNRIGELWCRLQHPAPRWPVNGHYECPSCLRRYAVVWANNSMQPEAPPVPRGAAKAPRAVPAGAALAGRAALAARM